MFHLLAYSYLLKLGRLKNNYNYISHTFYVPRYYHFPPAKYPTFGTRNSRPIPNEDNPLARTHSSAKPAMRNFCKKYIYIHVYKQISKMSSHRNFFDLKDLIKKF